MALAVKLDDTVTIPYFEGLFFAPVAQVAQMVATYEVTIPYFEGLFFAPMTGTIVTWTPTIGNNPLLRGPILRTTPDSAGNGSGRRVTIPYFEGLFFARKPSSAGRVSISGNNPLLREGSTRSLAGYALREPGVTWFRQRLPERILPTAGYALPFKWRNRVTGAEQHGVTRFR